MKAVFAFHLTTLVLGLLCLTLGFLTTFAYWLEQRALKSKREIKLLRVIPSLEVADSIAIKTLHWGVALLTLGIVSGIYLAHGAWKENWITDRKVILGACTWVWYLAVVGVRKRKGYRGKQFLLMLLVGYVLLILSFILSMVWAE